MNKILMVALFLVGLGCIANPTDKTSLDQHGVRHSIDQLKGTITVLDFAASWCQPCWRALPHLQALADSDRNIRVLVISVDETKRGRDQLVRKLDLSLPVIWDQGHVWASHFQPGGMPSTLILDANGKELYRHVGFSKQAWSVLIEQLDSLGRGLAPSREP